jgi:hypothetical protein
VTEILASPKVTKETILKRTHRFHVPEHGETALHLAALRGQTKAVRAFLASEKITPSVLGATFNHDQTVLCAVVGEGHLETRMMLLESDKVDDRVIGLRTPPRGWVDDSRRRMIRPDLLPSAVSNELQRGNEVAVQFVKEELQTVVRQVGDVFRTCRSLGPPVRCCRSSHSRVGR